MVYRKHPNSNTNNSNTVSPTLFGEEEIPFLADDVIDHLNITIQKKFPKKRGFAKVESNLKWVVARMKEKRVKYTLDDFKKVIEFKFNEWHGEEKTFKWIRPSTLFGEKFDGYLTAADSANFQTNSDWGSDNFVKGKSNESDLL